MSYDTSSDYGFRMLLLGIYELIQITVNQNLQPNSLFDPSNVPPDNIALFDFVLTTFYVIVVLMFINILIAMINNTYSAYTQYNDALLLMEKYNIMCGLDMSFFWSK